MALETATHINDLVITNPAGGDDLGQGDDHLRLLKDVLKRDLPMTAAASASGLSVLQGTPTAARAALLVPDMLASNVIVNGACNVQQRGSLAVPVGVTGYGGPDRFQASNIVAGGQFTQSAQTLTFGGQVKASVRQTVDTATTAFTTTNYWYGIYQIVEGFNSYQLKDKPFVVSFIFNANLGGTYSVSVRDGGSGYSYVSTFTAVANTPVKVTVAVPVMPGAASIPRTNAAGLSVAVGFLNQATYQTATLNSWLTGNFITASTQTIWAATAGNFIELTELQIEAGTVMTPFEQRLYPFELIACQRYFQSSGLAAGQGGTTAWSCSGMLNVSMRAIPTLTAITVFIDGVGTLSGVTFADTALSANGYMRIAGANTAAGALGNRGIAYGNMSSEL